MMSKKRNKQKKTTKNSINQHSQARDLIKRISLKLTFQGPLISQTTGVMGLGLDATMQRNSEGMPALNGTLIKGNIRHALSEFQILLKDNDLDKNIKKWFGEDSNSGSYEPNRANCDFDYHWVLTTPSITTAKQRTRISINDNGVVEDGMLQVVEDCFPVGCSNPIFSGRITLRYKTPQELTDFKHWIQKAIEYIPAMGSFKGSGFGKLISGTIKEENVSSPKTKINESRFGILLTLDRPFCIGRPITPDSNRIVSDDFIAGNIIKGIIARTYKNNKEKLKNELCFDNLIITHALPVPSNKLERPKPQALSLVIQESYENTEGNNKDKTVKEVIDLAKLSNKELKHYSPDTAPIFSTDWKPEDYRRLPHHNDSPKRIISLKTEIDSENKISKESKLFTLECIEPKGFNWYAEIDLCKITDAKKQKEVLIRLQKLLNQGLSGIGKTKAFANVSIIKTINEQNFQLDEQANTFIIKLITNARILPSNLQLQGTNSNKQLKKLYKKYWKEQVHSDLKLKSYFAEQLLSSSYYHQQRFNKDEQYYPEWLTKAGSVFVLKANTNEAKHALEKYLQEGLPVYPDVSDKSTPKPATWKTTPYLPEHGYGEICIKPQTGEADD